MLLGSNLKGFQHLGLPVRNIEKSIKWYSEILDFKIVHEAKLDSAEGVIKVAFLKLKDFTVEMYQLLGKDLEEIKSRKQGHIDHVAFDVDDINAVWEKISKLGIKSVEGSIQSLPFWEKGVKYFTILGPDEEKVEFNQKL
jgi:lactoylglutathione lyase